MGDVVLALAGVYLFSCFWVVYCLCAIGSWDLRVGGCGGFGGCWAGFGVRLCDEFGFARFVTCAFADI